MDSRVENIDYEELVAAIGAGDSNAEAELFKRTNSLLIRILLQRGASHEHAEDVAQEAYVVTLERLRTKPLENPSLAAAFLRRTAINLWVRDVRREDRRKTEVNSDLLDVVTEVVTFDKNLAEERVRRATRELINDLPLERDRQVLKLYYLDEWEKGAICEYLGIQDRLFNNIVSRARKRIRSMLDESPETFHYFAEFLGQKKVSSDDR